MRPKFTAGRTLWLRFLFKDSGHTWIMDLNATCWIITNLALERKIKHYTPMRKWRITKENKICKTTVIRHKVSTGGNLQGNSRKYMTLNKRCVVPVLAAMLTCRLLLSVPSRKTWNQAALQHRANPRVVSHDKRSIGQSALFLWQPTAGLLS